MKVSTAVKEAVADGQVERSQPKRILAPPHLEHAKAADLNNLTTASCQPTYDRAIR